jgi:hypothetical protein
MLMAVFVSLFILKHFKSCDCTSDILNCRETILSNSALHSQGYLLKLIPTNCDRGHRAFAESDIRWLPLRSRECRLGSWDRLMGDRSESLQLLKSRFKKDEDVRIGTSSCSVTTRLLRSDRQ